MSRSYKKYPFSGYKCGFYKNFHNRRIRRTSNEIADGKAYRKYSDPWNICDFGSDQTWEQYKLWVECHGLYFRNLHKRNHIWLYPDDADFDWKLAYHKWAKYYRNK